jgi:hypothetical protein
MANVNRWLFVILITLIGTLCGILCGASGFANQNAFNTALGYIGAGINMGVGSIAFLNLFNDV